MINKTFGPFLVSSPEFDPGRTTPNKAVGSVDGDAKFIRAWSSRNIFSDWTDGTSNQLIAGEKFIPSELWNVQLDPNASDIKTSAYKRQWDGSYLSPNAIRQNMNIARPIYYTQSCIKRSPNDSPKISDGLDDGSGNGIVCQDTPPNGNIDANTYHAVYGGIHQGICQFAVGDGTVHSIDANINWELLYHLAKTNDGEAVNIP
ncbi:MAG: DUF1559 domain-containing protein [Planctomycetaceae bacterium]|jgi:hypothetical protein|nr:DUF1559 domain-containing protein [Planctomycetaceae bacterium]